MELDYGSGWDICKRGRGADSHRRGKSHTERPAAEQQKWNSARKQPEALTATGEAEPQGQQQSRSGSRVEKARVAAAPAPTAAITEVTTARPRQPRGRVAGEE